MKRVVRHYSYRALKDLSKLDASVSGRIILKIRSYSESPNPLTHAKRLSGKLSGLFRYRIGDYRAIFEMSDRGVVTLLTILHIKHRKDIYRDDV